MLAHLALQVIVLDDLTVELEADALDGGRVGGTVGILVDTFETADHGPNPLVA